jgi:hypothetical protein
MLQKIKLILCLFLFGTATLVLQAQNYITTATEFLAMRPSGNYILMEDIVVNQMYDQIFTGEFNGNNHKITVRINEGSNSVGLFSEVSGRIENLIIDGYVIGGPNSENVGGLTGKLTGECHNVTNLANVTGTSATSCVGGVAGTMTRGVGSVLTNNGTIRGGQYVAGIIGKIDSAVAGMKYWRNAGTIRGNDTIIDNDTNIIKDTTIIVRGMPTYIAGIVAYVTTLLPNNYEGDISIHDCVNIGHRISSGFNYAGGIIA